MVAGRTTEPRSVTITTTNASAAVTAAANTFEKSDVGRTVTGTGITAGTTVTAVASGAAATLSANATATGARAVVLGAQAPTATGFIGWSPESETEAGSYTLAANNAGTVPPDRITNPITPHTHRGRG